MELETEFLLLGWGPVAAIVVNALCSERKRPEDKQPVDFWRAMEVIGLWAAALVGLGAIYFSTRDAGEQVSAMRGQMKTMGEQLKEMQEEGRPWVGPSSVSFAPSTLNEPLALVLSIHNFGKVPAMFVRHNSASSYFDIPGGEDVMNLPQWNNPRVFYPRSLCATKSLFSTLYPGENNPTNFDIGIRRGDVLKDVDGGNDIFDSVLDAITKKQKLYVVFGCITYMVANEPQYTTYCIMLNANVAAPGAGLSSWPLAHCPYGESNGSLLSEESSGQ
jgi:hypothetical protein